MQFRDSANYSNEKLEAFLNNVIEVYREKGFLYTVRYLSYVNNNYLVENESPMKNIISYKKILVEVYIDITYKDKHKIKRKDHFFGSGFFIDNSQILTAFYLIEPCLDKNKIDYSIYIKYNQILTDKVEIKAFYSLADIALIDIEETEFNMPVDLLKILGNSDSLKQGDDIYCLGHHSGMTSTLTKGIVSAKKRHAPEVGTWIQIDANITSGASGGLAIGADKKIYGIIVAGMTFEDINFVIPSNIILGIIDRLKKGEQITRPWVGLLLDTAWPAESIITISDIFSTSPLHLYNIKPGDKLISINHELIDSIKQAQDIVNNLYAGNIINLEIECGGGWFFSFFPEPQKGDMYAEVEFRGVLLSKEKNIFATNLDPRIELLFKLGFVLL